MISRERLHIANQKAKKVFLNYHGETPESFENNPDNFNLYKWSKEYAKESTQRMVGLYRKTKVFCSRPLCCGNPRNWKGVETLTPQERRSLDNFKQQLVDIN